MRLYLIWCKIQNNCDSMWIKKWIAHYFTPNCETQNPWTSLVPNPWASLVPPFLSKRMRAFQKSKKVHGVTRRVSHGWLKRQMLGCIFFFGGQTAHRFTFETFVATFSSSFHKKDCRKNHHNFTSRPALH
jgi:hypothetical protein